MNSPIWLRIVVQTGMMMALLAIMIPVISPVMDALDQRPDPYDPVRDPMHLISWAVLFLLLGASAAVVSRRLVSRPWDALAGVGLFAVLGGWLEWSCEDATRIDAWLPASRTLSVVIAVSVIAGCIGSAAILRRRAKGSGGGARPGVGPCRPMH